MNLAAEMAKLPEPKTDKRPPDWKYWRLDLWQRAQQDDPHDFMKWPCVFHTMLQDHWPGAIGAEANSHLFSKDTPSMMELAMRDKHPDSSWRNLIHQAYHILRWQEATGLNIADMQSIYEFGGGYGAMALVCNRLGFKGKYYIYDLPEFELLQRWYLEECGIDNVEWIGPESGIVDLDLFIACYSLSETNYQERHLHLRCEQAKSYLLLYSNKFEQYDNIRFFQEALPQYLERNWQHGCIEHLPPESWYSFGY